MFKGVNKNLEKFKDKKMDGGAFYRS